LIDDSLKVYQTGSFLVYRIQTLSLPIKIQSRNLQQFDVIVSSDTDGEQEGEFGFVSSL
jgi:hypothetical protein